MKLSPPACALTILMSAAISSAHADTLSTTVFEDICADKNTEVAFRVDIEPGTDVYFHKSQYIQLERQRLSPPTTPLFINALVNVGLSKQCAELLVRETPKLTPESDTLLAQVQFGFDKSSLTPTGRKILAGIIDTIKRANGPLTLSGHTDSIGSPGYNLKLGLKRADAVKNYLAKSTNGEIKTLSYGETRPIAPNNTPDGRQQNRRVEVILKPGSNTAK